MRTFISGQAGLGAMVSGQRAVMLRLDDVAPAEAQVSVLPRLFADVTDLRVVDCETIEQVKVELEAAWARDRALHLTMILLDGEEPHDVRRDAAAALDGLLVTEDTRDSVANLLYSAPLPERADIAGARAAAHLAVYPSLNSFLSDLIAHQSSIAERCGALDLIPEELFGGPDERARFRRDAVEAGAFRLFVTKTGVNDSALFHLLVHPLFRGVARARQVLQAWAAPFREAVDNARFTRAFLEDVEADTPRSRRRRKTVGGLHMYRRVEKQKAAIKELLRRGDRPRALKFVEQLVISQRHASEAEHLAKSLCDLATFAKQMGDHSLQLELAKRATTEAPADAWSRGQLGDAYRALGEYGRAVDEFALAGALGDERVALLGRAEVLKELGQLDEALAILAECSRQFPDDVVSRNAVAAALATYGRFEQSLLLYEKLCAEVPVDVVSLSGRASVLREMGRLELALSEFTEIVAGYPEELVPRCARGEVLRELGRLDEALTWFRETAREFSLGPTPRLGLARTLKELGEFDEALAVYEATMREFPLDQGAYIGIAEVHRRRGSVSEARHAYEEVRQRFPRSQWARNGLAAVLCASGEYELAEQLLPAYLPASRNEWIAYHIRGMLYMRSGRLAEAEHVLQRGMAESPWPADRSVFRTSVASLAIRQRKAKQALELLSVPAPPAISAIASVVRMHAHGLLGQNHELQAEYRTTPPTNTPIVRQLRDQVSLRFMHPSAINPTAWEDRLFEAECDALLLAA